MAEAAPARSRATLAAGALACLALLGSSVLQPRPLLVWNASSSTPVGLYRVGAARAAKRGDVVVAWLPAPARKLAAARRYLPAQVPLVKRVAAAAGDRVCAKGRRIYVNGGLAALRRARDPSGRPLSWWAGCRTLQAGELLLLSRAADAFDGRYFGVTGPRLLVGRARLLWPR